MKYEDMIFAQNWIEQLRFGYHTIESNESSPFGMIENISQWGRDALNRSMVWSYTREGFHLWSNRDNSIECWRNPIYNVLLIR